MAGALNNVDFCYAVRTNPSTVSEPVASLPWPPAKR